MNKLQETSLRRRSLEDLQCLIDNGTFHYHQCSIEKTSNTSYLLYWHGFGSARPQILDKATTLQGIIEATKRRKMDIKYYHWQQHAEKQ